MYFPNITVTCSRNDTSGRNATNTNIFGWISAWWKNWHFQIQTRFPITFLSRSRISVVVVCVLGYWLSPGCSVGSYNCADRIAARFNVACLPGRNHWQLGFLQMLRSRRTLSQVKTFKLLILFICTIVIYKLKLRVLVSSNKHLGVVTSRFWRIKHDCSVSKCVCLSVVTPTVRYYSNACIVKYWCKCKHPVGDRLTRVKTWSKSHKYKHVNNWGIGRIDCWHTLNYKGTHCTNLTDHECPL